MNLLIITVLAALSFFATIIIILAPKLVRGANAEQIAKGKATKSRDELRREIRIMRIVIAALILICVVIGMGVVAVL